MAQGALLNSPNQAGSDRTNLAPDKPYVARRFRAFFHKFLNFARTGGAGRSERINRSSSTCGDRTNRKRATAILLITIIPSLVTGYLMSGICLASVERLPPPETDAGEKTFEVSDEALVDLTALRLDCVIAGRR
jgi:hypothetical protein